MKKLLTGLLFILLSFINSFSSELVNISSVEGKNVSTYLIGTYINVDDAKEKLKSVGFKILTSYSPIKKGTTIVFTNSDLQSQAVKSGKAHIAVGRLFIDEQEQMISFTNPIYFGKAYMQDEYNHKIFYSVYKKINQVFLGLKKSIDKMNFDDLAEYHFMFGMPYYDDVDVLGEGSNSDLLKKAKKYKKGKLLVFELKLSEKITLLGYDLSKRTKKFVKKIGRTNAAILPYTISIENGVASSMEAKYYIALCYPLLTMTQFTTISTVPGAIAKDLKKPFK